MSVTRPLCEVCGKPEAVREDAAGGGVCWASYYGGQHSPEDVLDVLRATRRELDALRARLASLPVAKLVAYGRAVEEEGKQWSGSDEAAYLKAAAAADTAMEAIQAEAAKWREWG